MHMRKEITIILMLAATGCSQPKVESTTPIDTTTTTQSTQTTSTPETPRSNDTQLESAEVKPTSSVVSSPNLQKSNSVLSKKATLISNKATSRINIHDAASANAKAKHYGFAGDQVKILDEKQDDEGKTWYKIKFLKSRGKGWVSGNFVKLNQNDIFNSAPIIQSPSSGR